MYHVRIEIFFLCCELSSKNAWYCRVDPNANLICPPIPCVIIGIKHGFSCINIRQVPWEVLKTEAEGRCFQHLPRGLANVNALKNYVRSLLLHKNEKHLLHFALFLALFCFPFSRCRTNAISTDYARSRAGQYTSRDGSNFVAPVRVYWKLRSRALTARELPC